MIPYLDEKLLELLGSWGLNGSLVLIIRHFLAVCVLAALALLINYLTRTILFAIVKRIIETSQNKFDDLFLQYKVFHRLANFAPLVFLYFCLPLVFSTLGSSLDFLRSVIAAIMIIAAALLCDSVLNAFHGFYQTLTMAKERSIKGYIQVLKIFLYLVAIILVLSVLLNKSPVVFLGSLSALAAVLLLVFKDSILGLVASVQISANNMVKIGDWIEIPSRQADGNVIEVNLNTVKVQNWDKTISSFPTYALVSESFINWRGMEESEGRRIKRTIFIDINSVRFCSQTMLRKFSKIQLLQPYLRGKAEEIMHFNRQIRADESSKANGRRQTNLGVFRAYVTAYLKQHALIHQQLPLLVRQLQSTANGIPLEVYCFSKNKDLNGYESLQADIFDHLLAVISEFELKIFQNPSGGDFQQLAKPRPQ